MEETKGLWGPPERQRGLGRVAGHGHEGGAVLGLRWVTELKAGAAG